MAVAIIMCIILRFLENHISAFSITSKADRAALISRFSPKDREKHRQRYTSYHDFVQEKFLLFQFQCNQKEPRDVGARGARGAGQGRGAARGAPGDPGAGSRCWFPVLVPMPCSFRQLHLARSAGLPLETTGRYKSIRPVRKDSVYLPSPCREAQDGWTCSPEG